MEKNKFKMEEEGRRWGVSEGVKDVEVGCQGLGVERGGTASRDCSYDCPVVF